MGRRGIRAAVITVVGLGLFTSACSSPGDDPGPALPVDPAAIYAQMCARCHGIDGRGDPELKKTLPVRDFSGPGFPESRDVGRGRADGHDGQEPDARFRGAHVGAEDPVAVGIRAAIGAGDIPRGSPPEWPAERFAERFAKATGTWIVSSAVEPFALTAMCVRV